MSGGAPGGRLAHLRVEFTNGLALGPGKARLLAAIGETGSIAAAGRRLGMSYKRAWSLVEVLNAGFAAPLVEASRGGAGQGGARLTPTGETVLARYRAMEAAAASAVEDDLRGLAALLGPDLSERT